MFSRRGSSNDVFARTLVAGLVTGMRSQTALAILARAATRGAFGKHAGPPISWMRSPNVARLVVLSAAGEMLVDKLPVVPSRLDVQPMMGRIGFGALAGGIVSKEAGQSWLVGGLLGAIGAATGTFGGHWLRKRAGEATGVPDPLVAIAEDALAITIGWSIIPGD